MGTSAAPGATWPEAVVGLISAPQDGAGGTSLAQQRAHLGHSQLSWVAMQQDCGLQLRYKAGCKGLGRMFLL